jgi:hypothetical protein
MLMMSFHMRVLETSIARIIQLQMSWKEGKVTRLKITQSFMLQITQSFMLQVKENNNFVNYGFH